MRPRPWLVALALLGLVATIGPSRAFAHAVLVRATPSGSESLSQSPAEVALLFSEPLDPVFSGVRVLNASGQPVDKGDTHVDPNNERLLAVSVQPGLPNGTYRVVWRSLSAIDVHPDAGEYSLFVGVPVTRQVAVAAVGAQITATPETTLGRWWFYLAASLFGGVLAAWKLVLGGVLVEPHVRVRVRQRAQRLIVTGGALLIVGTLFAAAAQAAAAANVSLTDAFGKPLMDLLLRGRFASIWWPRIGLEVASLLLVGFGGVEGLAAECALATLPAVLLTSALTSHGAALPAGPAPGVGIDWLHIVGATAWVGGLIALLSVVPLIWASDPERILLKRLLGRFARFALVAATLVLVSGTLQAALELGTWTALANSLYGQLVLIKVALLVGMLFLAGFNEWQARRATSGALVMGRGIRIELVL